MDMNFLIFNQEWNFYKANARQKVAKKSLSFHDPFIKKDGHAAL